MNRYYHFQGNKFIYLILFIFISSLFGTTGLAENINISSAKPIPLIAFLTDYGEKDFYTGAVKGAILSIAPKATIIDVSHQITPFNIREGGLTLLLSAREFPKGTVFVAIVDPGVGTERRPILLITKNGKYFIGPDNGLFTFIMQEFGIEKVYEITNPNWFRKGRVSHTFHGRDIFGPAAAHLINGKVISTIGPELTDYIQFPIRPPKLHDNNMTGEVIFIDTYGNSQVNITDKFVEQAGWDFGDIIRMELDNQTIELKYQRTYGDIPAGEPMVLLASTEFLEIAINLGHAANKFGLKLGDRIRFRW